MVNLSMKRQRGWCAWLCVFCILFGVIGGATVVHAESVGSVYGVTANAERGGDVTVYFAIAGNPGVWGMKGTINYDTSVMTLKSVSAGSVFSGGEMIMADVGQVPFTFLANSNDISNKTRDGVLIQLTFTVKESANLGEYAVNISINQAINANDKDVAFAVSGARIKVVSCLHSKTVVKNAVAATETEEGYSGDTYCTKCNQLIKKGDKTPVVINTCEHKHTTWTVTQEPACEEDGKKELICDDCDKHLEEETIEKTGHEDTEVVNQKAATTTEEGYTGDVQCEKCQAIVEEGTVIPKIKILVFNMTTETQDAYIRGSQEGLVYVSSAERDTFVRVEVNGEVLKEDSYILESGTTKITLKPEYLEKLPDGKYTVTIVSDAGTASAQFTVENPVVEEPSNDNLLLIITIVSIVIALGSLIVAIIAIIRKNREGGYSKYEEK